MEVPFIWRIADSGYELQEIKGKTRLMYAPDTTWTSYPPLQKFTGLFRIFIDLDTKEKMLHFANHYGLLGVPMNPRDIAADDKTKVLPIRQEWLVEWTANIQKMRGPVKLWNAMQNADHDYVKQVIRWKKSPKRVSYEDGNTFISIRDIHTDGSPIKYGDTRWPAWFFIQDRINEALKDSVAPRMLWNSYNELKIYHAPKTLLGVMWLQFADAVSYDLEFRECAWCGMSFEITRTTRSDRLYCSNSCRVSASRKRTAKRK